MTDFEAAATRINEAHRASVALRAMVERLHALSTEREIAAALEQAAKLDTVFALERTLKLIKARTGMSTKSLNLEVAKYKTRSEPSQDGFKRSKLRSGLTVYKYYKNFHEDDLVQVIRAEMLNANETA